MYKPAIMGWTVSLGGTILWLYGCFATGDPSFIDWQSKVSWQIADYLPNLESEIGVLLITGGIALICWPHRR